MSISEITKEVVVPESKFSFKMEDLVTFWRKTDLRRKMRSCGEIQGLESCTRWHQWQLFYALEFSPGVGGEFCASDNFILGPR